VCVDLDPDRALGRFGAGKVPEVLVHVVERVDEEVAVDADEDHPHRAEHDRDRAPGPMGVVRGSIAPVLHERPDQRGGDHDEDHRDCGDGEVDELVDAEPVERDIVGQPVTSLRNGRRRGGARRNSRKRYDGARGGQRPPPRMA
jgi:hypothetical protein